MERKLDIVKSELKDKVNHIGENTIIKEYSFINNGAIIGKNCIIGRNVSISDNVKIGDNVIIENNVNIYDDVEISDNVFIGASCVINGNIDSFKVIEKNNTLKTKIDKSVIIGANSTINNGYLIGKNSIIYSGTVINENIYDNSIISGNPAKKIGIVDEKGEKKLMNEKKNILITGITGSLGRSLCKELINLNRYNIFGIYNSEQKFAHFKRDKKFMNIKCFKLNISDKNFEMNIDFIIKNNHIDYIIHSGAMKHVDICEDNPLEAINTNIIASQLLVKYSLLNNIKNLIALSTDKSIEPCNVYGYSKLIMQSIVLNNGYSVYQGANFFWSDGSVLDIWFEQMNKNKKLTVTNLEHERYFNTLDYVSKIIIKNIDIKNSIILPEFVYLIKVKDLLDSFMEYFNYFEYEVIGANSIEKNIEEIDETIGKRIKLDKEQIKNLIKEYFN